MLGFVPDNAPAKLRETVEKRARDAGQVDFEALASSGNLSQQIAAQCANALFEFVILTRALEAPEPDLDQAVMAFLEGADIPVIVAVGVNPRLSRILICTRAGKPGKGDVRYGGRLARYLGARVSLLHIARPDTEPRPLVGKHLGEASVTLSALEVTNEILNRVDANPAEAILREAAEHNLVVIGGHGPQARSVFGRDDVTIQVLARARCPVLVVPAEE